MDLHSLEVSLNFIKMKDVLEFYLTAIEEVDT